MMRRAGLVLVALCFAAPALAKPVLEKVIILQRHGVRAPTKAPADLAPYARNAWAAWPVGPGELTDHGAASLGLMGDALRLHYTALGLLPKSGCTNAIYVWADNSDQRTRRSGAVMAAALAPGCNLTPQMAPGDVADPLFHPADDFCPIDSAKTQAALSARLPVLLVARRAAYDAAVTGLQSVLDPDLKPESCTGGKKCVVAMRRNDVKDGKLSGTLADGSTLAENIYLEYAQGMPQPGWGRVPDAATLAGFMPLHQIYTDLARRTPALAAQNGSLIARQIRDALSPVPAFAHEAPVPKDAKFILLAGHDTNISNIAGMLGLDWTLPGEPDVTAPDSALAFEVWRDDKGGRFVRLAIFYQTPDQLRNLNAFDAAHPVPHLDLALPGCAGKCPLAAVTRKLDAAVAPQCIKAP
jgi:4-phytase/acid phosphatase